LILTLVPSARAQEVHVRAYVQDVTPEAAWILWETTAGEESRVDWGTSADTLNETAVGAAQPSEGAHRLHEVELTGLSPGTRYYYRTTTGAAIGDVYWFSTPPIPEADVTFRMVAVSDMQIDRTNPTIYREVIHDGVLDFLATLGTGEVDEELAFVLVPGDLVDTGDDYDSWRTEFFDPAADLMSFVPFYPVLGNHENNSDNFYRYFHLPDNGSPDDIDRWWTMDYANVRVIGLDSNLFLLNGRQERFFEAALEEACSAEHTDFVFVELHHAHRSELWPQGEQPLTTQVVERMEQFSRECGKPSLHFYGHTHGYSRGESRDASHLWINVASAGGNLDYWGEYPEQRDVDEVSVSQDEWGFVLVEVTGGADPTFRLQRLSRGNETLARDNELRDEIVIRTHNAPPATPSIEMPRGRVTRACDTLLAGAFTDGDGDEHGATHWQVSTHCDGFESPVFERYRTHENWYGGVDLQEADDLTDEPLEGLDESTYYCWRVRYRDRGLAWSAWSEPTAFLYDAAGTGVAGACTDDTALVPPALDAGPAPTVPSGGCGCAVERSGTGTSLWLLAAGLLVWRLRRARRPRRRRTRVGSSDEAKAPCATPPAVLYRGHDRDCPRQEDCTHSIHAQRQEGRGHRPYRR